LDCPCYRFGGIGQNNVGFVCTQTKTVARIEPVLADDAECALVDGMPVVPRSERHHLPKVSLEPTLSNEQTVEHTFAANEELETVKFFVEPVLAPVNNVAVLPTRLEVPV
jgi:hypothetical protein